MRDKNRIKPFMLELADLWENNCPDWRFGQFIENVLDGVTAPVFFIEDDEMLEIFKKYFNGGLNVKNKR